MDFIDLKRQQARLRGSLLTAIEQVLDHGAYILGPEVQQLESALGEFAGTRFCVSCSSGTDALLMPLMAAGVGPGDAVFVPSLTFIATAEVVALLGATPVFVDIRPDTYNIDVEDLKRAIAKVQSSGDKLRAKAIIPVDLFGQPADYIQLQAIAQEHGLLLLEDAAQSFGASYHGKRSCSLADIAATSFFPAKPLGGYGDGGAVFCDDEATAEALRSIRVHGQGRSRYENVRIGLNGRLDTLQAAVLLEKLRIFPEELELRQSVASRYSEALSSAYAVPDVAKGCISAWAQYSLLHPRRDAVIAQLQAAGIPTAIYYPVPLHLQTAFQYLGYQKGDLPISERIAMEIFSVPMHPYLDADTQDKIIAALLRAAD